jgi:hypothetical protein
MVQKKDNHKASDRRQNRSSAAYYQKQGGMKAKTYDYHFNFAEAKKLNGYDLMERRRELLGQNQTHFDDEGNIN